LLLLPAALPRYHFLPAASNLPAYHSGFLQTPTHQALQLFLRDRLAIEPTLSCTLVEAEPTPGRLYRYWYSVAWALSAPPDPTRPWEIPYATRHRIDLQSGNVHLLVLPTRLWNEPALPPDPQLLGERREKLLSLLTQAARSQKRTEHWLLLSTQARWLSLALGDRYDDYLLTDRIDLGSYTAYQFRAVKEQATRP
jgi:hypothetical protein